MLNKELCKINSTRDTYGPLTNPHKTLIVNIIVCILFFLTVKGHPNAMAYTRCVMGNPILLLITKSMIKTETK